MEGSAGILQAGSASDPRLTPAKIHLIADSNFQIPGNHLPNVADQTVLDALGHHGLVVVDGGKLHLFGKPRSHSWLKLKTHAASGASACEVDPDGASLDWETGDRIFLASTDFDRNQAEERDLNGTPSSGPHGGMVLPFASGLNYQHFGGMVYATGKINDPNWAVPEFGEVGLLNRNVVVAARMPSGAGWTDGDGSFGHVMLLRSSTGTLAPVGQLSWTELHHLGVTDEPGRYPIHFHHGDVQNPLESADSFVEFSSLHDCCHRWISLHNQKYVRLEGNVGFKTQGHGYYMEEYGTRECKVIDNLGAGNEPNEAEPFPATFWFENPKMLVQGNHAAGSAGSGMWLEPALGDSWEHTNPAVSCFCDNVAHSNETWGIIQDAKPEAFYEFGTEPPTFSGLEAWKNRRHGIWIRSLGKIRVQDCKMADNRAGMYPASEGLQTAGPMEALTPGTALIRIENCLFLGETANVGNYPTSPVSGRMHEYVAQRTLPQQVRNFDLHDATWDTLAGVEIYDGLIELKGCRFGNFEDRSLVDPVTGLNPVDRKAGGITQVDYDSNYGAPCLNNAMDAQQFDTCAHPVYWRIPSANVTANMARTTVLLDQNGSLNPGYGAFQYLMPQTPFLVHGKSPTSVSGGNLYSLPVTQASYGQLILKLGADGNGLNPDGPIKVDLGWWHSAWTPQSDPQDVVRLNRADPSTSLAAFPTNALINEANIPGSNAQVILLDYYFTSNSSEYPDTVSLTFQYAEALNQYVIAGIPFDHDPSLVGVECNGVLVTGSVGDLSSLRNSTSSEGLQRWRWESASSMLWIWSTAVPDTSATVYPEGTRAHWEIR